MSLRSSTPILLALLASAGVRDASAQPPQQQPLVQAGDITYLGQFTLPMADSNGTAITYGSNALGMGADGTSLYFGCVNGTSVVRVTVPTLGGVATVLEPCATVPNIGAINPADPNAKMLGGVLAYNGRMIVTARSYYDGGGTATTSHWAGPTIAGAAGPFTVGTTEPGLVHGYMATIPQEWRALLGGPALTGFCCGAEMATSSHGPSASVFDPNQVGTSNPVPATMLVGYPQGRTNPVVGSYDQPGPFYNGSTRMGGIAFPAGTRSVLFIGSHGATSCDGAGTSDQSLHNMSHPAGGVWCYDPVNSDQGTHGYPYGMMVWAYDANDLAAVQAGTTEPWSVVPYATWPLDPGPGATVGGATYDPATKRLYVTAEGSSATPTVHVFEIAAATATPPEICGDGRVNEGCPEVQGDGIDNDRDGLIDEGGVEICGDGFDNDLDGQIDEGCPPPLAGPTVTVNPSITHQTMRGWESVAYARDNHPAFAQYAGPLYDLAVDAGVDRLRLEVRSGMENPGASNYTTVNDNADPNVANLAGFRFDVLDTAVEKIVVPMRTRLAARGERLYINLNYVAFTQANVPGYVHKDPAEYAEFMLVMFQHMQQKYGFVPDGIEIILEPDNVWPPWNGDLIGRAIVATNARLTAAGFTTPDFIGPSVTCLNNGPSYFDGMIAVPGAKALIKEAAYHRYCGADPSILQTFASKAKAIGIGTSMLEWWSTGNTYETLHEDLKVGRASAWQQEVLVAVDYNGPDGGGGNTTARVTSANPTQPVLSPFTRWAQQYYRHVRLGAVRQEATSSTGTLDPLAFRNVNGRQAVVVKASGGMTFSIVGLDAGTYSITHTTSESAWAVAAPSQTLAAGGALSVTIPAAGVLTAVRTGVPAPTPPGTPQQLVGAATSSTVSFSWDAPVTGGAVGAYVLEAGVNPGEVVYTVPMGLARSFSLANVGFGRYYVRVRATNSSGSSASSNEVMAAVGCDIRPGIRSAQAPGNDDVPTWVDPDGCGGTVNQVGTGATGVQVPGNAAPKPLPARPRPRRNR